MFYVIDFVPEVRAGSSWEGWEVEEGVEELHRCNPDCEGRGAGLHPSTGSSHERTAWRALQSVSQEKGGQVKNTHTHCKTNACTTVVRQWYILWSMAVRE